MRIRSLIEVGIELEVIIAKINEVLEAKLKEVSVISSQTILNKERDIEERIYDSLLRVRESNNNQLSKIDSKYRKKGRIVNRYE